MMSDLVNWTNIYSLVRVKIEPFNIVVNEISHRQQEHIQGYFNTKNHGY